MHFAPRSAATAALAAALTTAGCPGPAPELHSQSLNAESADMASPVGCVEAPVVPALWFPLDEQDQGLAPEIVDGQDGFYDGPIVFEPGSVGDGALFAGSTWIERPDLPILDAPDGTFTFAAWLRSDGGEPGTIAAHGYGGTPGSWALRVADDPAARRSELQFDLCDVGGCTTVTLPDAVEIGVPAHVSVVVAPGRLQGVDIQLRSTEHSAWGGGTWSIALSMLPAPGFSLDATGPLSLGATIEQFVIQPGPIDVELPTDRLHGLLDEAMYWTEALSPRDLDTIAAATPWGLCDDCLNDTTPPVITCPAPVSVQPDQFFSPAPATATDDCDDNPSLSMASFPNPPTASMSSVDVTYFATDASGNTSSCTVSNPVDIVLSILSCSADSLSPTLIASGEPVAAVGSFQSSCPSCNWHFRWVSDLDGPVAGNSTTVPGSHSRNIYDFDTAGTHTVTFEVREYSPQNTLIDTCTAQHSQTVFVDVNRVPAGTYCGDSAATWQGWIDNNQANFVNGPATGAQTLTGVANRMNLILGNPLDNDIDGQNLRDCIYGGSGADTIHGGGGSDEIHGEGGADDIHGDAGADVIYGGTQDDRIWGDDGDDELHGEFGDDTVRGGDGNDEIWGDDGADTLRGNDGADHIWGGAGADDIEGNSGNDTLHGGDSGDRIHGNGEADWIYGDSGNDTLIGDGGNDRIWGGIGDDRIEGESGDDQLHGEDGNDDIFGGSGADQVWGDDGWDEIRGGSGDDILRTGAGAYNKVRGDSGDDTIIGNVGIDFLMGDSGDDDLFGGDGNDRLCGDSGSDTLNCGNGNDGQRSGSQTSCEYQLSNSDCSDSTWDVWQF